MKAKLLGMVAAAAVLAASALPASAAIPLGTLPLDQTTSFSAPSVTPSAGGYTVDWTFSVLGSSVLTTSALLLNASVPNNTKATTIFSNNVFKLYSGTPNTGSSVATGVNIPATATLITEAISNVILAPGDYYLEATGIFNPKKTNGSPATGATLGLSGSISVTAVPEASTWAMMFLGFAALGFAGYRSRRSADASA